MGAYYNFTVKDEKGATFRVSSWAFDNGAKLLEHSFVGNNYVESMMNILKDNPMYVGWLCDYHEEPEWNWDVGVKVKGENWEEIAEKTKQKLNGNYYIVNHSKYEYIDMAKYRELAMKDERFYEVYREEDKDYYFIIHPLPILANSDLVYMGGGDYGAFILRSYWFKDKIEVKTELPDNIKNLYTDITELSLIPSEEFARETQKYINYNKELLENLRQNYEDIYEGVIERMKKDPYGRKILKELGINVGSRGIKK